MVEAFGGFELDLKLGAGIVDAPEPAPLYKPPPAEVGDGLSVNFVFQSPAGASVTQDFYPIFPISNPDLSHYSSLMVVAILQGGTGGVLDVYLQAEYLDGGWVDIAHFVQLIDGNVQIRRFFSVTRHVQQTTITTVGTDAAPALAANTVVGGSFGKRLRVLCVTGAGMSAGAQQLIGCYLAR